MLKYFSILFIAYTLSVSSISASLLDRYQWENRLVLIFSDQLNNAYLNKQLDAFKAETTERIDRDIILFVILKDGVFKILKDNKMRISTIKSQELRKIYNISINKQITNILIGKDGYKKGQYNQFVEPWRIYSFIDSMPMRRHEMRNN